MSVVWGYWVEGTTKDNQRRDMLDYYTGDGGFEGRSMQERSRFTKKVRAPTASPITCHHSPSLVSTSSAIHTQTNPAHHPAMPQQRTHSLASYLKLSPSSSSLHALTSDQ